MTAGVETVAAITAVMPRDNKKPTTGMKSKRPAIIASTSAAGTFSATNDQLGDSASRYVEKTPSISHLGSVHGMAARYHSLPASYWRSATTPSRTVAVITPTPTESPTTAEMS